METLLLAWAFRAKTLDLFSYKWFPGENKRLDQRCLCSTMSSERLMCSFWKCPPSFEEDPSWNHFEQHVSLQSKCVRSAIIAYIYHFEDIIWFLLPSVFFSNMLLTDWGKKTMRFIRYQNSDETTQECVTEGVDDVQWPLLHELWIIMWRKEVLIIILHIRLFNRN